MKGKFLGFEIVLGPSVADLASHLFSNISAMAGFMVRRGQFHASISVQGHGRYLYGKVIRLNSGQTLQQANTETLEVSVLRPDSGCEVAATSYFILSAATLRGMYLRYDGVFPFAALREWLEITCRELIKAARKEEIKNHRKQRGKSRRPDTAAEDDPYFCHCGVLFRSEHLEQVLARWHRLTDFKYTITTVGPGVAGACVPLADYTKREVRSLRLTAGSKDESKVTPRLIRSIVSAAEWVRGKFGDKTEVKIVGENQDEAAVTIDPDDIVDPFAVIDVSQVVSDIELKKPRHYDTLVCRRMTETADENTEYFGTPSR